MNSVTMRTHRRSLVRSQSSQCHISPEAVEPQALPAPWRLSGREVYKPATFVQESYLAPAKFLTISPPNPSTMNMLYRFFAILALVVAYVTAETVLTAEKHVVSFNNK